MEAFKILDCDIGKVYSPMKVATGMIFHRIEKVEYTTARRSTKSYRKL